jgi:hypothetical protein
MQRTPWLDAAFLSAAVTFVAFLIVQAALMLIRGA